MCQMEEQETSEQRAQVQSVGIISEEHRADGVLSDSQLRVSIRSGVLINRVTFLEA